MASQNRICSISARIARARTSAFSYCPVFSPRNERERPISMSAHIDSHNHFWRYCADEYSWIGEGMDTIRRDFLPSDLLVNLRAAGIDGTIAVQARQTVEETEWLLHLSETHDFIRGVVGWVPLTESELEAVLERLCEHQQLKG